MSWSCPATCRPSHAARRHLQLQPLLPARLLHRLGCEVSDLGIVPDRREATVAALRRPTTTT
jgi:hypothetical protein